jgi:hypothetical protein
MLNSPPEEVVPQHLLNRPWLLCLWMLICPHRALHQPINAVYKAFFSEATEQHAR